MRARAYMFECMYVRVCACVCVCARARARARVCVCVCDFRGEKKGHTRRQ